MTIDELVTDEVIEGEEVSEADDTTGELLESIMLLRESADTMILVRKHLLKLGKTKLNKMIAADLATLIVDVQMFIEKVEEE